MFYALWFARTTLGTNLEKWISWKRWNKELRYVQFLQQWKLGKYSKKWHCWETGDWNMKENLAKTRRSTTQEFLKMHSEHFNNISGRVSGQHWGVSKKWGIDLNWIYLSGSFTSGLRDLTQSRLACEWIISTNILFQRPRFFGRIGFTSTHGWGQVAMCEPLLISQLW